MDPLPAVFRRFLRLLPFLVVPNSFHRLHVAFWLPFPDVWEDAAAPPKPDCTVRRGPRCTQELLGQAETPYVVYVDHHGGWANRSEPFW